MEIDDEEATMTTLTLTDTMEELDERQNDGMAVSLLWDRAHDALVVRVVDAGADGEMWLDVTAADAMDVFRHPYAYAAFRGIGYRHGTAFETS